VNSLIFRKGRLNMTSDINRVGVSNYGGAVGYESTHNSIKSNHPNVNLKPSSKPVETTTKSTDPVFQKSNVKEAVDFLNTQMASDKRSIGFTLEDGNSTPIVTIRNTTTGEVVRQIPNEVVIKLSKSLDNLKGAVHNKQA
jgi:uncharacterized FlaG/YvyC family protein